MINRQRGAGTRVLLDHLLDQAGVDWAAIAGYGREVTTHTMVAAAVSGGGYVVAAFLITCLVATATGTSLGTILVCVPMLYPGGPGMGADPAWLMGAIIGGATFGDNVSPVSDTTIGADITIPPFCGDNWGTTIQTSPDMIRHLISRRPATRSTEIDIISTVVNSSHRKKLPSGN